MKKFCLLMAAFTFLSVMPSFAIKIIVNNETDRTVPSRSSDRNVEEYIEQDNEVSSPSVNVNRRVVNSMADKQRERFNLVYKPILEQDFRRELIGTTWHYPDETQNYSQPEPIQEQVSDEQFNDGGWQAYNKKYIREAADYYVVDTINRPNEAVPVGYEEL